MKISTGQEYAAKIINTKKLSARGESLLSHLTLLLTMQAADRAASLSKTRLPLST